MDLPTTSAAVISSAVAGSEAWWASVPTTMLGGGGQEDLPPFPQGRPVEWPIPGMALWSSVTDAPLVKVFITFAVL